LLDSSVANGGFNVRRKGSLQPIDEIKRTGNLYMQINKQRAKK
jgi:hypothetical protein